MQNTIGTRDTADFTLPDNFTSMRTQGWSLLFPLADVLLSELLFNESPTEVLNLDTVIEITSSEGKDVGADDKVPHSPQQFCILLKTRGSSGHHQDHFLS